MNEKKRRKSDRATRAPMVSPGRPTVVHREQQKQFWEAIARGMTSEEAAILAGASPAVGTRWFRDAGGMPSVRLEPMTGRFLSLAERELIALLRAQGGGVRSIAEQVCRSPSTISRETRRNAATGGGNLDYRAVVAQWHADRRAQRPKAAKLATNDALREYVQVRLAGTITTPSGTAVPGPPVHWRKRRHGPRQDRRWAIAWSPEQIAQRLKVDFPDNPSMRISHEAIYQALFIQGRGALQREMVACLRTGRTLRVPRARTSGKNRNFISEEVLIDRRPREVDTRSSPGHWEGDLIIGLDRSAIGTLVERSSRYTVLLHLPPMVGHSEKRRDKTGPALAGHGASAVRDAIVAAMNELPKELRHTLTWDQGAEMAQYERLSAESGLAVYFCNPHSPWQRGTNENTNGLLRQYFPKGTNLSRYGKEELDAIATALNRRPRKTLNWRTPEEVLTKFSQPVQNEHVASTG